MIEQTQTVTCDACAVNAPIQPGQVILPTGWWHVAVRSVHLHEGHACPGDGCVARVAKALCGAVSDCTDCKRIARAKRSA